tara:strand:- start:1552 stop:1932 length:381 start_codon:yes stop_codon:yes gene_type:complete
MLIARAAILSAVFAFAGCDEAEESAATQTGYFKSDANERVIAYHSDEPLTREDVEAVVSGQVFTQGRLGRVVFYSGQDNPAPADALTLAADLPAALQVTANPPFDQWDWVLSVNPAGERSWKSNVE